MTLQPYQTSLFNPLDTLTLSAEGFRARLSRLQEIDEDLKIQEELYSLKSQGSHLFSNLEFCFLKMSKGYSTTTKEEHSKPSCKRWMSWGTTWNGKCLTAKILECHKTENECSLSDILEEKVDEKYFLSEHTTNKLLSYQEKTLQLIPSQQDTKESENGSYIVESKQKNVIRIKEATKQGYAEATIGDSVNISHPNSKTRRGRVGKQIANTLLTGEEQCVVMNDVRIRKLTPKECWRLQGFPDWAFEKAEKVNSNSQLYKQAGNSVTVNVIAAIARRLV